MVTERSKTRHGTPLPRLLVILDKATCNNASRPVDALARELVDGGARFIWYRNKIDTPREIYEEAVNMARIVSSVGGVLVVGDRADIAVVSGAAGVHLSSSSIPVNAARSLPGIKRIGWSCHNATEIALAERAGADYVTISPVFEPNSPKPVETKPIGVLSLATIVREADIPVFALGGIDVARVAQCMVAGAYGAAVMGSITLASDPVKEFQRLDEIVTVALRGAKHR